VLNSRTNVTLCSGAELRLRVIAARLSGVTDNPEAS
jgi:hypothetical protein